MKGYVYTIEVMMAISIIAVTAGFLFGNSPEKPDTGSGLVKERLFSVLEYLDAAGLLRVYVANNTEGALEGEIAEICTYDCDTTNVPGNRSVVSVNYYVATYRGDFIGKKVKAWAWTEA